MPPTPVAPIAPVSQGAPVSSAPHIDHTPPTHDPAGPSAYDDIFEKKIRFADLGLREDVLRGVTDAGFEFPTTIQARIIPVILSGKDVLGQAKTGTGKTAAFGLPLLNTITKGQAFSALLLVPTRELCLQVSADLVELGKHTGVRVLPVYGGQNINTQAERLARGPEVIVATPGRIMDMAQRGYLHYHDVKIVVLDEVDRMLDIGFRDDIRKILSACPKDRQTVFVSATLSSEIESLARGYANNAEKIIATSGALTATLVKQYHLPVQPWDKKQLLLHLLTHETPELTIVFCRTKRTVDNLSEYLTRKGVDAQAIHGDMMQNKRNRVIEQLKAGKMGVLVASDLASRGLDVDGITHVVNYDLPDDPDLYVHRIGRTARAGRGGVAWSLVTPEQGDLLTQIEFLINAEIPKLDYPDFKPGPLPPDVIAAQEQSQKRAASAKVFNRFGGPAMFANQAGSNQAGTGTAEGDASQGGAEGAHAGGTSQAHSSGQTQFKPSAPAAPVRVNIAPDPSRFPGGIVPSKLPMKRMGGKVMTARSMKAAIAKAAMPGSVAPPPPPQSGS